MTPRATDSVTLVEVAPRDGLQHENRVIPTDLKVAWIDALSKTGLPVIEVTSFVRPDRIPQLADAEEVMDRIMRHPGTRYTALVPNLHGLERALAHRPDAIAVFTAASESFNRHNIETGIEGAFERMTPVIAEARRRALPVRGYLSTAIGCPYEGWIDPARVAALTERLFDLGVDEVSLGDTIGVGTPKQVRTLLDAVGARVPLARIAVHFHDTYGQGIANVLTAVEAGIRTVDASLNGLGGCPFAPGASGNVATEEVVYLLEGMGLPTGVSLPDLLATGDFLRPALTHSEMSRLAHVPRTSRWLDPGRSGRDSTPGCSVLD
jgi:hydroxymethylglutaryl-CoA lyase